MMACATAASPQSHADPAVHARQLFELGVKQQRAGQSRQAIVLLSDTITSRGLNGADAARSVFDRGLAFDSLGNSAAAIADYTEALRLEPSLSAARNNRGNAYRRIGQAENAKRDYLAALTIQGGAHQYPYYGLGLIAVQAGDRDGARAYFQKALAAAPGFSPATQSLAALRPSPASKPSMAPPPPVAPLLHRVAQAHLRPAISDSSIAGVMVQLGAFRDEESALAGWSKTAAAAGGALDSLKPVIVTVDLPGKGRFWRLRAIVPGKADAHALCAHLVEAGRGCMLASY